MARLLGIGEKFPEFTVDSCISLEKGKEFQSIGSKDLKSKWSVFCFWPLDFTFVCPSEIIAFHNRLKEFKLRKTEIIGVSVDSHFTHFA